MSPINLEFALTPDQFQAVRLRFAEHGVDLPEANSGELSYKGVTAGFTYDGEALRVAVTDKPFLASERMVREKLTAFIESSIE